MPKGIPKWKTEPVKVNDATVRLTIEIAVPFKDYSPGSIAKVQESFKAAGYPLKIIGQDVFGLPTPPVKQTTTDRTALAWKAVHRAEKRTKRRQARNAPSNTEVRET